MLALHGGQHEGRVGGTDKRAVSDGAEGEVRTKADGVCAGESESRGKGRGGGESEHFDWMFGKDGLKEYG